MAAANHKHWLKAEKYFNREHSWLLFNQRVLQEAENLKNPLFERIRFLSIFESNQDEFYMIRVSGLVEQVQNNVNHLSTDGLHPQEQLDLIESTAPSMRERASELWKHLHKELEHEHVYIKDYKELSTNQKSS
jgi:polyphosphate kinase